MNLPSPEKKQNLIKNCQLELVLSRSTTIFPVTKFSSKKMQTNIKSLSIIFNSGIKKEMTFKDSSLCDSLKQKNYLKIIRTF